MSHFLDELIQKCPLTYGKEAYRSLFREIYRNGSISLRLLSFNIHIPVSELTKSINYLVEKKIISRVKEGLLFTEDSMPFIEKELQVYGFGVDECELCDGSPNYISPRWDLLKESIEDVIAPLESTIFPENILARAIFLYEKGAIEGKDVFIQSHHNILAYAISSLYLGIFPETPEIIAHSMVINEREENIRKILREKLTFAKNQITIVSVDLNKDIASELVNSQDSIILDAPPHIKSLKAIITQALILLKEEEGKEIYLFTPKLPPHLMLEFQRYITDCGVIIDDIYENLNCYYLCDPAFEHNSEVCYILKTSNSTPNINTLKDRLKDSSIAAWENPEIFIVWCENCTKPILIGQPHLDFPSFDDLIARGCPHCQAKGPFNPDEIDEDDPDLKDIIYDFKHGDDSEDDPDGDSPQENDKDHPHEEECK